MATLAQPVIHAAGQTNAGSTKPDAHDSSRARANWARLKQHVQRKDLGNLKAMAATEATVSPLAMSCLRGLHDQRLQPIPSLSNGPASHHSTAVVSRRVMGAAQHPAGDDGRFYSLPVSRLLAGMSLPSAQMFVSGGHSIPRAPRAHLSSHALAQLLDDGDGSAENKADAHSVSVVNSAAPDITAGRGRTVGTTNGLGHGRIIFVKVRLVQVQIDPRVLAMLMRAHFQGQ